MKTLRPYQQSAVDSIFDWLYTKPGHPLVVAPVGSGKSLMLAETIRKAQEVAPRTRIVVLSHVKELLEQDAIELRGQYPEADFGFYSAGLGQKKLHNDITFATIQSAHSKVGIFNRCPELVLIDEAHLISHNDATQYRKFIDSVLQLNPNAKIIGFTGTPFRADTGRLDEGDGKLFDGIAYEIDIRFMIENGYLCKPVVPKVDTEMSVEGVKTRGGDYIASQLEAAVDVDATTKACIQEMLDKAADRKKWLIFTAGVEHCGHVLDGLKAAGITAEMVTGKTPKDERESIIRRYKNGDFRALVNVAVLTTGFNCPDIDMLAFMRPTKSPVLYIQTIGRGLRTAPGKENCLILDFGGVIKQLGPIDALEIRKNIGHKKDKEPGDAVTKRCPSCGEVCAAAQKYCYSCSYCFFENNINVHAEAQRQVLSIDEPPEEYEVLGMALSEHVSKKDPTKLPTLCVTYSTMDGPFREYICFNHPIGSYPRDKAVYWHKQRLRDVDAPISVSDAAGLGYPCPSNITVKKDGKYWRVVGYDFSEKQPELKENINFEELDALINF